MKSDPRNSVCSLLWNQISIGSTGALRICCNSNDGFVRQNDQLFYPANESNLNFVNELPFLRDLRSQMLKGHRPKICDRCWRLEDNLQTSFRQLQNVDFESTFDRILNGDTQFNLEYLNLDLGNHCNLACRMCSPGSSSLVAKQWLKGEGILEPHELENAKSLYKLSQTPPWFKNENFWKMLEPHLKNLKAIYLIGGEPFLIPEHLKILNLIIEFGKSENVKVIYNSNLTLYPEKYFSIWEKFKEVHISASIDGTDEYYEYIRWPAKYKVIKENFDRLTLDKPKNVHLNVHCTVQNLNIVNLPEVFQTFSQAPIFFIPVDQPNFLNAGLIPPDVLDGTLFKLFDLSTDSKFSKHGNHSSLLDLINHLNQCRDEAQFKPEVIENFVRRMLWMDGQRGQNLLEIHPYFSTWVQRLGS